MYITETRLMDITKQQYLYKFKAYSGLFFSVVVVQILGLLASLNGVGMMGTGRNGVNITESLYSSSMVIGFTLVWALATAIIFTAQVYRNTDFAYVSNRLSSNLSSIGFLLTAGIAAGVMAALAGVLLRVIMFFSIGSQNIAQEYFFIPPLDLLFSMFSTTLYIVLFLSGGYFLGTLTQVSKVFIVVLPLVFILALRLTAVSSAIVGFIFKESSLTLFTLKVLAAAALLFSSAILLSNRLEVRR